MFACLEDNDEKSIPLLERQTESYPAVVYVTTYLEPGRASQISGGVFESEYDAQQYCIDHTTSTRVFSYYIATFKPPGSSYKANNLNSGKGPNYPNYMYPTAIRHDPNVGWDPVPPYAFANESDASDFVAEHSNEDVKFQYSIQNYIPANTYNYGIHGFVGHHNLYRKPREHGATSSAVVMPSQVIYR
jgi:hypothetical protein